MLPTIDTHCHLMNFDYLPDQYTKHLLRNKSELLAKFIEEEELREGTKLNSILKLVDEIGDNNLHKMLNALLPKNFWGINGVIDNLVKKGEFLSSEYIKESGFQPGERNVNIYVPLMMDFIVGSNITKVHNSDGVIPYVLQLQEIAHISRTYPWQIFPFFAFHPRRKNALTLLRLAVEQNGFVGIKMYPAMGFYPDFRGDQGRKNNEIDPIINKNLEGLYSYIAEMRTKKDESIVLPINAHAQYHATQGIDLKPGETLDFTNVMNWDSLIREYDLKINFAHFGGTDFLKRTSIDKDEEKSEDEIAKEFSKNTTDNILALMNRYNSENNKQIFADLSAHSYCLKDGNITTKYFSHINYYLKEGFPLMYGSDLPVIAGETTAKDYINTYEKNIEEEYKENFFSKNALEFLFHENTIPANYLNFMKFSFDYGYMDEDPFSNDVISKHRWVSEYIQKNLYA